MKYTIKITTPEGAINTHYYYRRAEAIKDINKIYFSNFQIATIHNLFRKTSKNKIFNNIEIIKELKKNVNEPKKKILYILKKEIKNFNKDNLKKIYLSLVYMENKLKLKNPDIKDETIKQYINYYINVSKLLKKNPKTRWLFNVAPMTVFNTLKENYANSSLSPILTSLIKILYSNNSEEIAKKYIELKKSIPIKELNIKTDKQIKNWISKEEVLKLLEELKKIIIINPSFLNFRKYLILLILTKTPLRNDLAGVLMVDKLKDTKDNKNNYYVKDDGLLILNHYKTSKRYGQKKIPFNKEVQKVILDFHKLFNNKYLISNENGEELTPSAMSKLLIRLFKKRFNKNIGTQMLRHIMLDNKDNKEFIKKKKEFIKNNKNISDEMGHNLSTHENYILL